MREIRSKMAPSASETTKVAAIVGETEKQGTSEDLEETTDMPEETIEIATVATETEASEESAVCNSCVTLKAKVVALQKTCSRLRQKAVGPSVGREPASVMSEEPSEDSSSHDESEHSSKVRTDDSPPSQTSFDPKAETSESSEILSQSEDEEHESRNEIRLASLADKITAHRTSSGTYITV